MSLHGENEEIEAYDAGQGAQQEASKMWEGTYGETSSVLCTMFVQIISDNDAEWENGSHEASLQMDRKISRLENWLRNDRSVNCVTFNVQITGAGIVITDL